MATCILPLYSYSADDSRSSFRCCRCIGSPCCTLSTFDHVINKFNVSTVRTRNLINAGLIRRRPRLNAGVHGGLKEINARAFIQGNTVYIYINSPCYTVILYVCVYSWTDVG